MHKYELFKSKNWHAFCLIKVEIEIYISSNIYVYYLSFSGLEMFAIGYLMKRYSKVISFHFRC